MVLKARKFTDLWNAFIKFWETRYVAYSTVLCLDQEAELTANGFEDHATVQGPHLQFSVSTAHNSLGTGEKYHLPIRRVFTIL